MTSKQKLTILAINTRSGVAKASGRPYTIREAQCILEQSKEGASSVVVGVVNLSEELAKDRMPGDYLAEFELAQGGGNDSGKLVPRIVSLTPFGLPKAKPAAGASAV
ncbi:cellulose synthase [Paraburkholderia bryophila]|uniref:cellulose synthase n=1 Tax=Paraburkholderia bryophila TaxID=420952 RepID=UPI0038BBC3CA